MDKEYPLNRIKVPTFYTLIEVEEDPNYKNEYGRVFAASFGHSDSRWLCLGYVSRQTPFGQGIGLGILKSKLRKATKKEVLKALETDHLFGIKFRPCCREALDASFHLVMSSAIANWTNDTSKGHPIINISRHEIIDYANKAMKKHETLMSAWKSICRKQIKAIKKTP